MLQIQNTAPRPSSPHPILNLGFRVFFVGAAAFSVVSMLLWLLVLQGVAPFKNTAMSPFYWHAHEMIFGYGLAVIAGFLLTAVKTWTGQTMPYGKKLLPIFVFWALARLFWLGLHAMPSTAMLFLALVFDGLFWGLVTFFVVRAVWAVKQKRQIGIVLNLLVMWLCQGLFYVGVFWQNTALQKQALYLAFYLVVAMILTIGRRVLPFFIEKGIQVDQNGKPNSTPYSQNNSAFLDVASVVLLALFVLADVFLPWAYVSALFALLVALVNGARLVRWHHRRIWQKSLLWSLYLSFWGLVLGFVLLAWSMFGALQNGHSLGVHTLAVSGIGLTTLAMMARVSLGHTGRSIHAPPKGVVLMFVCVGLALLFRVFVPIWIPNHYMLWILCSQVLWIGAFGLFLWLYTQILASERPDGLFG